LIWAKDELSHVTTFTVDNLGRTLAAALPTGGTITATFDAASNRTSVQDPLPLPNQQIDQTQFHFDTMNRVDRISDPNNLVATYVYDAAGNLQDMYDRVILQPSGNHRNRHFIYDDASRLITEQWRDGTTVKNSVNYGYDAASELTSATDNNSANSFAYDSRSRMVSADNANNLNIPHVVLTSQYDLASNRTQLTDNLNGAVTYGYDADDRLTKISMNVTGATDHPVITLQYDLGARLTNMSATNSTYNESYSYTDAQQHDLNGNRSSANGQTYGAPAPANRLTTDGQYTYTYDNEGNLLNKTGLERGVTYSYDFTWDYRNRLTEAKKTQVSNSQVVADDHFTYDVFDRRIGKLTQGGTQQWIVYDGVNVYADFSGQTLTTRYLYGNRPDQIFARTDGSGNSTAWYLTDRMGSVRLIVNPAGSQPPLYAVNYFSFGGIVPESETGTGGDRFKFTGREWDSEIGLQYNRARYYDPATGRWMSQEPLGFAAGDSNLYRYVHNIPTNLTDPSGEWVFVIAFVALLVGASTLADPQTPSWTPPPDPLIPTAAGLAVGVKGLQFCYRLFKSWSWQKIVDWADEVSGIPSSQNPPYGPFPPRPPQPPPPPWWPPIP
jgi:RHS repeat-associated protein